MLTLQKQLSSQLSKPYSLNLSSSTMGSGHSGYLFQIRGTQAQFTGVLHPLPAAQWFLCNNQDTQGLAGTILRETPQTPSTSKDLRLGSEYLVLKPCIYLERPCQAQASCSSSTLCPAALWPALLTGGRHPNKQLPPALLLLPNWVQSGLCYPTNALSPMDTLLHCPESQDSASSLWGIHPSMLPAARKCSPRCGGP